jgi:hypothetical protein
MAKPSHLRTPHPAATALSVTCYSPSGNASVCTLATRIRGDHHDERYARTRCLVTALEGLPAVNAKHKQRTAAQVAWLAGNQEKMARLQDIGYAPPVAGNVVRQR